MKKKYIIPTSETIQMTMATVFAKSGGPGANDQEDPGVNNSLAPQQFSDPYIWDETDSEKKAIQSGENIELID